MGNIESLQMTASSRTNLHTDLIRVDETRGNITVEEGDLLVNEKNIDRQTYAHHSWVPLKKSAILKGCIPILWCSISIDLACRIV